MLTRQQGEIAAAVADVFAINLRRHDSEAASLDASTVDDRDLFLWEGRAVIHVLRAQRPGAAHGHHGCLQKTRLPRPLYRGAAGTKGESCHRLLRKFIGLLGLLRPARSN